MALPSKASFWKVRGIPRVRIRDVRSASKWFQSKADHQISDNIKAEKAFGGKRQVTGMPQIGSMYLYGYHAKWDKTLPTWDKFPLCFIFDIKGPHFWGLNFHYLPIPLRYQLGAALMETYVRSKGNKRDYLKLSYPIIQGVAKAKLYEPATKQYLFTQLKTKFSYIHPDEWAYAVAMPVQRFVRGKPY